MDLEEFQKMGYEMVDYIVDYFDSLPQRRVMSNSPSGCLTSAFPSSPPETGDSFEKIMEDVEQHILPGLTHWQHPGFHGYFPAASSFPAILGSMFSDIIGHVNFNWNVSPSGCELEIVILNWYGGLIGLPQCFLRNAVGSRGTGIMLRSTSECIFLSMITARRKFLRKLSQRNPSISTAVFLSSLTVYCSSESDISVKKVALISLVNIRVLEVDENGQLIPEAVAEAIKGDKKIGLIPFFVHVSLGAFTCGSCDPLKEIGRICDEYGVWLHVDAAYAGNAMICPEYRYLLEGVEYASSFHSSPSQWLLVDMDCTILFVKDRYAVKDIAFSERTNAGYSFFEKDWCYPNNSEFRALTLYFVLRNYGVEALRKHIRNHVNLAKLFADYVAKDERFELIGRSFGLVCFRLTASDLENKALKKSVNNSGKLFITPSRWNGKYVIRFCVCSPQANENDIKYAWKIICEHAAGLLDKNIELLKGSSSDVAGEFYKYSLP